MNTSIASIMRLIAVSAPIGPLHPDATARQPRLRAWTARQGCDLPRVVLQDVCISRARRWSWLHEAASVHQPACMRRIVLADDAVSYTFGESGAKFGIEAKRFGCACIAEH